MCLLTMLSGVILAALFLPNKMEYRNVITLARIDTGDIEHNLTDVIVHIPAKITGKPFSKII